MRRLPALAVVLVAVGACAPTVQESVQRHTHDGIHLFRQGSYAGARDCFQEALKERPDDPDLLCNLARCHHRMAQLDTAERLYRQCLQANPDHLDARHAWVLLMRNTGRKNEAATMVRDWLRNRPQQAGPYVEDGWLLAQEGDLDRARARYQEALDRDPRQPRALAELGEIYQKLGRPDRALVLYERALEADRDQPALVRLVGDLRARQVGRPHPD
jgi:tetratricopeptide (TPR) repeat protein